MLFILSLNLPYFWALAVTLFQKYVFSDWNFVGFLAMAIMLDTASGVYVAAKKSRLYSFKMRSVFEKLQYYAVGLVITHIIASHQVDGEPNPLLGVVLPFFKGSVYLFMLVCEAISIEENLQKIGRGYLPHWIRKRLLDYKETGPLNELEIKN